MKLLFVHQRLGAFGGAESNILLTAKELALRGHSLGLLFAERTGRGEDAWEAAFPICDVFAGSGGSHAVHRAIQDFAPDAIYLHSISDLPILSAVAESGVPVVRMVHDHALYCLRTYKYNYFTRKTCSRPVSFRCVFPCLGCVTRNSKGGFPLRFSSYLAKRKELALNRQFDAFVVYSEYCREELIRNGFDSARIHIHVPMRSRPANSQLSSFSSRNLIIFSGQIIRGKGVDVLLQALAKVQEPFECAIVGDGNHRAYCEQLARKLNLHDKVRFEGFVPAPKLGAYYLEASLAVVSSVWPEPFGMAGPEAMLYGLPVVAFDSGGISEWLTDFENGFLVPWMDTDTFARRISQLLRHKELARAMGRRGFERVNRNYDAALQVGRLEELFLGLCPQSRAAESPPDAFVAEAVNL